MADDPPETFIGDSVDLGGLVLEHLAMAIDPYPRKAGEEFPADEVSSRVEQEESDPTKQSPFAVLEALKREDERK